MSIWVSWPARVDASEDSMWAAVALLVWTACSPRQRAPWYVLQAVATAASASSRVASSSTRVCLTSSASIALGEDVDGAGDDEADDGQRDERLQRHGELGPHGHGHHVGRAERGAGGEAERQ